MDCHKFEKHNDAMLHIAHIRLASTSGGDLEGQEEFHAQFHTETPFHTRKLCILETPIRTVAKLPCAKSLAVYLVLT